MGMTIDEIIKYLPAPICGDTVIGEEKQKEYDAHDTAVNILRKYQKIVQIMERTVDDGTSMYDTLQEIEEVIEDGNDNS